MNQVARCSDGQLRLGCVETFTASQLSGFVSLFLFFYSFVGQSYTPTKAVSVTVNVAVLLSIVYFILGSWIIEERHYYELRQLSGWRHVEFWWRVTALVFLSFFTTHSSVIPFKPPIPPNGFPVTIGLGLMVLATMYLLWDLLYQIATSRVPPIVHADFGVFFASTVWVVFGGGGFFALQADAIGMVLMLTVVLFLAPLAGLAFAEWQAVRDFFVRLHWRNYRERVR